MLNFKNVIKNLIKILYIFPINNKKIFLMSFNGETVGFDSKAFVNWLNKNKSNEKYKIYWGVKSKEYQKKLKMDNVNFVKIKSLRGFFHMITSKILLYNINPPSYIKFRKKQILVNTWHGGIVLKRVR